MPENPTPYQPGPILHEAITGAFRARGTSFHAWCDENGVKAGAARNATYGQSRGPKGRELLRRLIEAAGRDLVHAAYTTRMTDHMAELRRRAG